MLIRSEPEYHMAVHGRTPEPELGGQLQQRARRQQSMCVRDYNNSNLKPSTHMYIVYICTYLNEIS